MQCPSVLESQPPMSFLFVEPRAAYSFLQTFPREFALAVRLMVPLMERAHSRLAPMINFSYDSSMLTLYIHAMPGAHQRLVRTRACGPRRTAFSGYTAPSMFAALYYESNLVSEKGTREGGIGEFGQRTSPTD